MFPGLVDGAVCSLLPRCCVWECWLPVVFQQLGFRVHVRNAPSQSRARDTALLFIHPRVVLFIPGSEETTGRMATVRKERF